MTEADLLHFETSPHAAQVPSLCVALRQAGKEREELQQLLNRWPAALGAPLEVAEHLARKE
jgi:hypothetical protein